MPRPLVLEPLPTRLLFAATPPSDAVPSAGLETGPQEVPDAAAPRTQSIRELVFIDPRVPDRVALLDDLRSKRGDGREFDVIVLDRRRDGISQITDALATRRDVTAVHILSHGTQGAVELGGAWVTRDQIAAHAAEFQAWRAALTPDADILVYGCDVAAGIAGEQWLAELARLTEADVAASIDRTGQNALGGNWNLEATTGPIERGVAFREASRQTWSGVLGVAVDATSTGSVKSDASITVSHTTAAAADRLMLVSVAIDPHGAAVSTVTYNGVNLTLVGVHEPSGAHTRVELWAMTAPASGTHDVVVTMNATNFNGAVVGATTLTGVDQATPLVNFTTAGGSSASAAITVSSKAGDLVYATIHSHNGLSMTPGAGQTELFDVVNDQSNGGATIAAGAPSVSNTWTVNNGDWSVVAVSVQPVSNNAPVLDIDASPVLGTVNEDAGVPSGAVGTPVSSLIGGVTDADGDPIGIAVTAADAANGTWYYSTNNGGAWNALGAVGTSNARLLAGDANTRIYFKPGTNYNGTLAGAITFRAWDGATGTNGAFADTTTNGGSTAFSTATDSASLVVNAVNDAPVNTVPATQAITEDTSLVFSGGNGNAITIADVDAGAGGVRVTLAVGSGSLTLASLSGLTFTTGDGVADGTLVFSGTVADVNAALNGLTFTPAADASGSVTLSISTEDQGNTGSGGALSASDAVAINVTAVNDAPVNSLPPGQSISGGSLIFSGASGAAIAIADADAGSAQVQVSLSASTGTLTLGSTAGLTFTSGDGNSDGAMTFRGTVADINAALEGMTYQPPILFLGTATISVTTSDLGNTGAGGAKSDSDTLSVGVTYPNTPPVDSVPGAQTMNEDGNLVFSSAGGNAISISDTTVGGGEMKVTLSATNGRLTLAGLSGLTFVAGDGTSDASMTFRGTLADVNNALSSLVFTPTANFNGAASLQVSSDDLGNSGTGGTMTDSDAVSIAVTAVNDAPVITNPGAQTVSEDTLLTFSSVGGNAITISDADAASGSVTVIILANLAAITLASVNGLTFIGGGDGTDDGAVTFSGTIASVNAALDGMTLANPPDFVGAPSLTITVNDGGNSGAGGAKGDVEFIPVTITAVNDAPAIDVPPTQTVDEDHDLVFSAGDGNAITISDIDATVGLMRVTLAAANGTLTLADVSGLSFLVGDGTADVSMTFTGTLGAVNAALDGLRFRNAPNFGGSAGAIAITVSDQGNSGSGGERVTTESVAVNVSAVNDPPIVTAPATQTVAEDTPITLSWTVADVDATSLRVTLTATGGTITLADLAGLTFIAGDGTSDALVTFEGSAAALNGALDGLVFTPAADFNGAASLNLLASDLGQSGSGGALSDSATVAISVSATNDAPVLIGSGGLVTYGENDAATRVDFAIAVGDLDDATLVGATVRIVNFVAGEDVLLLQGVHGMAASFDTATGVLTLSGVGTVAQYEAALQNIRYVNTSERPDSTTRTIRFQADDGSAVSVAVDRAVSVTPVNDAPGHAMPPSQAVAEDGVLTISGLAVTDADAGTDDVRVTLAVTQGRLTLADTAGLTFIAGDGVNEASVTFEGSLAAVNAALSGMTFSPDADYNGPASLTITTDDLGHNGGPAESTTDVLALHVDPVNDTPTAVGPLADVNVKEDAPATTVDIASHFADIDDASLSFTVLGNSNAALFASVTIDPATGELRMAYAPNAYGAADLVLRVTDAGGVFADLSLHVNVSPQNDAPVVAADSPLTIAAGTSGTIGEALLRATDVDNTPEELRFTLASLPQHGFLMRGDDALAVGDSFTQADVAAGRVRYVHATDATSDSIIFTIDDGAGAATTAKFRVSIALPPVSPPPPPSKQPPSPPPPLSPAFDDAGAPEVKTGDDSEGPVSPPPPAPVSPPKASQSGSSAPVPVGGGAASPSEPAATPAPEPPAPPEEPAAPPPFVPPSVIPETPLDSTPTPSVAPSAPAPPAPAPVAPSPMTRDEVAFLAAPASPMAQSMAEMHEQITGQGDVVRLVAGTAVVSLGVSVGYVLWILRAGYLLSSMLSSMPAWQFVDPLPILNMSVNRRREDEDDADGQDDDSLQTLIGNARRARRTGAPERAEELTA